MKRNVKNIVIGLVGLMLAALPCGRLAAWQHANRYGGSTSHTYGSTTHTSAYGTSTSHTYGEGASHTNYYGGSTSHSYYGGTTHTTTYGTTYHTGYDHYYGGYHGAYHPPTTVNVYGSGCYDCGGWALAAGVTGAVVGAAVASSKSSAATSNAYTAGYTAGTATTTATAANAYNAGVAAGVTAASANMVYTTGEIVGTLPAGCANPSVNGVNYYLCGNTWFQPSYGANGVYYRVVPTP